MQKKIQTLYLEAMHCRSCFDSDLIQPALIDLAQPRWVGPAYWTAKPRILIVLINPGSGKHHASKRNSVDLKLLNRAFTESSAIDNYLKRQRINLSKWGRGRFWKFFVDQLELDPDAIALANIAWCASRNDRYPKRMLENCFEQFTHRLLSILSPDIVILSGAATDKFSQRIQRILPHSKILSTLHFAHRKGKVAETSAIEKIKHQINAISDELKEQH